MSERHHEQNGLEGRVTVISTSRTIAVLAALAGVAFWQPAASDVTLHDELQILLDKHPQLRASRDGISVAGEQVNSAKSQYLPTVTLNSDTGYSEIDGVAQCAAQNTWRRGFDKHTLTMTQNLFDGQRKAYDTQTAELNKTVAEINLVTTRQNLLREAATAYVDIIRQRRLVDLTRENEGTVATQLNLEDERVQRGGGTAIDVLVAKTRLQSAKEQRVVFEGNLKDALTRYTQVFGHPPPTEPMVDPSLPIELMTESLESAIQQADLPPRFVPYPMLVCLPSVLRPGSAAAHQQRRPERAGGAE